MPSISNLMRVEPVHAAIGSFFEHKPMFRIPKYQRGYAWDKAEIEDFLQDVDNCFNKRKANVPVNHFFGGIVSVKTDVSGVVSQTEFELVDGQQRMATFVLMIAAVIGVYKNLEIDATRSSDTINGDIIRNRINELSVRYIEFNQEVNRVTATVPVFVLSSADNQFFYNIIRQIPATPNRDSHNKLLYAYTQIAKKVKELTGTSTIVDKLDNLEIFKQLLDGDMSLIHIKTFNKQEAYTLFRVLNDRGKSLTDGDLLRARTLELLEGFSSEQTNVEAIWDEILSEPPSVTEEYLKWIYTSYVGSRARTNNLFDDFVSYFYPASSLPSVQQAEATQILTKTQEILLDIQNCRRLNDGEWPFVLARPVTKWDTNRLSLLIKELRLTVGMPLLLAACKLDQPKFSEVVKIFERFMFRFKVIGNQHVTPVVNIIQSHSVTLRSNPAGYNVADLKRDLHSIQLSKVPDVLFKSLLDNLNYKEGGGNQSLKYFLMTLEYYVSWYHAGATGEPQCQDTSRIYDFTTTTLEHIYPRNKALASRDTTLEPLKNMLGNLTFMGPADNVMGANDDFIIKKPIFVGSSVTLNKEIGANTQWQSAEVNSRLTKLKDMAVAIFNI